MSTDQLLAMIEGIDRQVLERWIAEDWVRTDDEGQSRGGNHRFQEIDFARIRLILELHDLNIDDGAMPLVLGLLDQLYGLRRRTRWLCQAVLEQPPAVQQDILNRIAAQRDA